jgi:hypothetical protein
MSRTWKIHSDYFSQNDVLAVHAAITEIFSEKLQGRLFLKITAIENYVSDLGAWGKLTWRLKCNGTPISPFHAQKSQIGQPGLPQEVVIDFLFPPASLLSVDIINSDIAVDYVGGIVLKGEYGTFE